MHFGPSMIKELLQLLVLLLRYAQWICVQITNLVLLIAAAHAGMDRNQLQQDALNAPIQLYAQLICLLTN
jgi:hypothetical protein